MTILRSPLCFHLLSPVAGLPSTAGSSPPTITKMTILCSSLCLFVLPPGWICRCSSRSRAPLCPYSLHLPLDLPLVSPVGVSSPSFLKQQSHDNQLGRRSEIPLEKTATKTASIEKLYFETRGTELHGMDRTVLMRAMKLLEQKGKVAIFKGSSADDKGVKFSA